MIQSNTIAPLSIPHGRLSPDEVLAGYDAVSDLYPYVPSLLLWRAWEYAAYRRFALEEPVLDIGCGDGRYFRLVWPQINDVTGVDIDPGVADAALRSGVYRDVYVAPAHALPAPLNSFGSAFANCSLEHMDQLDRVLSGICRSLRPGAPFVLSVVTDKFVEWGTLPLIAARIGEARRAQTIQANYEAYHHLVSPFPVETWAAQLDAAGFEILEHIPILPELTSRAFMFVDQLWHVRQPSGEVGDSLHAYLSNLPAFPKAFRQMVAGVLDMERDWTVGSGAVFLARKRAQAGDHHFLAQAPIVEAKTAESMPVDPVLPEKLPVAAARCWCGNTSLALFSPHYLRCPVCETLVTAQMPAPEFTAVHDDEQDFYGREYWFSHQEHDLGHANILQRARADMPERVLHWLRALLKYKLPPAQALELGSAHGGLVALMRWAGFDASGLELSPWVVDFARQTFDVPMLLGPVEDQTIAPGTLDAIVLMDVLEHLPDPLRTMQHCLNLLKPDGILLIQTPRYAERQSYADMVSRNDPFLMLLRPEQHLYLLSEQSIRELFRRLGAEYLAFEQAIFGHYDMFVVVSRAPLAPVSASAVEQQLLTTAGGRMVLALLDLDTQRHKSDERYAAAEADRAARLHVIERQGAELSRIAALEADVAFLKERLQASEADRAARLHVIERQGTEIGKLNHLLGEIELLMNPGARGGRSRLLHAPQWRRVQAVLKKIKAHRQT